MPQTRNGAEPVSTPIMVDVAKRWRGIRITPDDLEKLKALWTAVAPLAESA